MDLIGKTLYIVRGNLRDVERGHKEQFDVEIIETKIVKETLDPFLYAKTVMGYQTEDIVFRNNWFCDDWLDIADNETPMYWRVIDKKCGTQIVITLDKERANNYRTALLKELQYTVDKKRWDIIDSFNKINKSSANLDLLPLKISIYEVADKNNILSGDKE